VNWNFWSASAGCRLLKGRYLGVTEHDAQQPAALEVAVGVLTAAGGNFDGFGEGRGGEEAGPSPGRPFIWRRC